MHTNKIYPRRGPADEIVERIVLGDGIIRRVYGDGSCTDVCITSGGPFMLFGRQQAKLEKGESKVNWFN